MSRARVTHSKVTHSVTVQKKNSIPKGTQLPRDKWITSGWEPQLITRGRVPWKPSCIPAHSKSPFHCTAAFKTDRLGVPASVILYSYKECNLISETEAKVSGDQNRQPFLLSYPCADCQVKPSGSQLPIQLRDSRPFNLLTLWSVDSDATFFFKAQICKEYAMSRNKFVLVSRVSFNSACVNSLN